MNRSALAGLVVLLCFNAQRAHAGCTLHMECTGASRAGPLSKNFPDEASCRREQARGAQYSACTYRCVCGGGVGSSGSGAALDPGQALMLQGSYLFGQMIGAALMGGTPQQRAAQEALQKQRLEEEMLRRRQKREEEDRRFQHDKQEILGQIKGPGPGAQLGFKETGQSESRKLEFKQYHARETEREKVIEKLASEAVDALETSITAWCQLHPVLYPSRGSLDASQWKDRLSAYNQRHNEWLNYCRQDFKEVRQAVVASVPKTVNVSELEARADCAGAFRSEVAGCSNHTSVLAHSDCVNRGLESWKKCPGVEPAPSIESQTPKLPPALDKKKP